MRDGFTGWLTLEVGGGTLEEALPNKGLAEEELNVLFRPVLCREALEEHHDFLKVHADELVGPFDEEGGADVEVEFRKSLLLGLVKNVSYDKSLKGAKGGAYKVGIPHANGVLDTDFPHQKTVHPPETELNKLDAFSFQVLGQVGVYSRGEIAESGDLALNTWLGNDIVVLDTVEQLGQTPKGICFYSIENRLG